MRSMLPATDCLIKSTFETCPEPKHQLMEHLVGDIGGVCPRVLVLPINVCGRAAMGPPVLHLPTDPLWIGSGGGSSGGLSPTFSKPDSCLYEILLARSHAHWMGEVYRKLQREIKLLGNCK